MNKFYRKIRKLILHPKKYFIDFFYKALNIQFLNDRIAKQERRISELNRMINILTVYTDHKGLQRGDLFIFANQDKIFPDDFIRAFRDKFYKARGYFPNLKNPKTFNEKINWLKFNYYDPNERICGEKSTIKKYISDRVGSDHVLPLLGVYEDVSDIDFDALPEQFVLKNTATGMGTGVLVIRDKSNIDLDKLRFELNARQFDWVKTDYLGTFNPKVHDVKLRIIAEPYIEQINGRLYDYKFFCFHGRAQFFYMKIPIDGDRYYWLTYDLEFKRAPFQMKGRPLPDFDPTPPRNFNQMIDIANKVSEEFPFLRVDLYSIDEKIYVGELTFAPDGGYFPLEMRYDIALGKLLDLEKIDKKYLGHWEKGFKFVYDRDTNPGK